MSGWVKQSDYPKELRVGESGLTGFRLYIGSDGRPTRCVITSTSGYPVLDARTCEVLMKRARFEPGRDGYNRPIESNYSNRVRWIAPTLQSK